MYHSLVYLRHQTLAVDRLLDEMVEVVQDCMVTVMANTVIEAVTAMEGPEENIPVAVEDTMVAGSWNRTVVYSEMGIERDIDWDIVRDIERETVCYHCKK